MGNLIEDAGTKNRVATLKARIKGAPDRLPRTFVGVHSSRGEAAREATSWGLGWLRTLREAPPCPR